MVNGLLFKKGNADSVETPVINLDINDQLHIMQNLFFRGNSSVVEHNLAKVGVASSSLVSRSISGENDWKLRCFVFPFQFLLKRRYGGVAEWSCSGLQSRGRRFDSDPRLQNR